MMSEMIVFYEQDEVYVHPASRSELPVAGKLRIVQKARGIVIEWIVSDDDGSNSENGWAIVSPAAVSFTHHNVSDTVEISTSPRQSAYSFTIPISELRSYRVGKDGSLTLIEKDGTMHRTLYFHSGVVTFFEDTLAGFVSPKCSEKDPTLFLVFDKQEAAKDDELSAMNLVPARRLRGHMLTDAPARVLGFLNNMKRDPYGTTLNTFSKVYDLALNYDVNEIVAGRDTDSGNVEEIFGSLSDSDDLEPGFAILTRKTQLIERPLVKREPALTLEEFQQYVTTDGRIHSVDDLKQRIFKGGLHPTLRRKLWCYLLGYYEWDSTHTERKKMRERKKDDYFRMKQQWKTISDDQESRFTAFRERKSHVEKDVSRTDRNHPFYENDDNPNIELLYDILMTYVMYDFDLGYVQGMSDLLAPILYVTQNEETAFWCFDGFMKKVIHNFDMDQQGMKDQFKSLRHLVSIIDPAFMSYLEAKEAVNLCFCFRWLLVWFKRELNYSDILRLWEVLWTGLPCPNFHLFIACALLDTENNTIQENGFGFTEILKHINDISMRIDLEATLVKAEGMFMQVRDSPSTPNVVRQIVDLPLLEDSPVDEAEEAITASIHSPSEDYSLVGTVTNFFSSALNSLSIDEASSLSGNAEETYEAAISSSFL